MGKGSDLCGWFVGGWGRIGLAAILPAAGVVSARRPYPNLVNHSKYLDFWLNRSLIFVDGRYILEEEYCVLGL